MIVDLPLSGRSRAALAANGFRTVADLCTVSMHDLRLMKGVGPRTVERLLAGLSVNGIFLWGEQHEARQASCE
ncbi:helix-hairpin-helix domain-containing protein [Burkholderia territorii]|uniref:helix-hairpin-helix domain-containing protein n=1 Tax=Burkholderia territorii TaxID=1503055 RepID=UPI0018C4EBAC|nr:helix-hairpin-helix domain-containing protein [Burkholderia territorii]